MELGAAEEDPPPEDDPPEADPAEDATIDEGAALDDVVSPPASTTWAVTQVPVPSSPVTWQVWPAWQSESSEQVVSGQPPNSAAISARTGGPNQPALVSRSLFNGVSMVVRTW